MWAPPPSPFFHAPNTNPRAPSGISRLNLSQLTAEDARGGGSEGVAKPACLNMQFIAQHRHDLTQAAKVRYQRTTNTLQFVLIWGK